jgi:hypothetical protein
MADNFGPETYAPRNRRPAEKESAPDQSAPDPIEGQIRRLVRRDLSLVQRQGSEVGANESSVNEKLNVLLRHLAGDTIEEIDRVIRDLENVRDVLRNEGERIEREIAGFASLNHTATVAIKVISDSVKKWKGGSDQRSEPDSGSD